MFNNCSSRKFRVSFQYVRDLLIVALQRDIEDGVLVVEF